MIISNKSQQKLCQSKCQQSRHLCRCICQIDGIGIYQNWEDAWKFPTKVNNNWTNSNITKCENSFKWLVSMIELDISRIRKIEGNFKRFSKNICDPWKVKKKKLLWFMWQINGIREFGELMETPKNRQQKNVSIEMSKKSNRINFTLPSRPQ